MNTYINIGLIADPIELMDGAHYERTVVIITNLESLLLLETDEGKQMRFFKTKPHERLRKQR